MEGVSFSGNIFLFLCSHISDISIDVAINHLTLLNYDSFVCFAFFSNRKARSLSLVFIANHQHLKRKNQVF